MKAGSARMGDGRHPTMKTTSGGPLHLVVPSGRGQMNSSKLLKSLINKEAKVQASLF